MPGFAFVAEMGGVLADIFCGENGRLRKLISLLDEGEGQGYTAWRVLSAPDAWQTVVENGLYDRVLNF